MAPGVVVEWLDRASHSPYPEGMAHVRLMMGLRLRSYMGFVEQRCVVTYNGPALT